MRSLLVTVLTTAHYSVILGTQMEKGKLVLSLNKYHAMKTYPLLN